MSDKLSKEDKEKLINLQRLQQQVQTLLYQKQTIELDAIEVNNALSEIKKNNSEEAYQIVGNIMVKKSKGDLIKSLENKKDVLEIRLNSYDKQIKKISNEITKLQDELFRKERK